MRRRRRQRRRRCQRRLGMGGGRVRAGQRVRGAVCGAAHGSPIRSPERRIPIQKGSSLTENNWLRSWSNDLYLWYDEIADRDPGAVFDAGVLRAAEDHRDDAVGQARKTSFTSRCRRRVGALAQSGVIGRLTARRGRSSRRRRRGRSSSRTPIRVRRRRICRRLWRAARRVLEGRRRRCGERATQADVDTINAGLFPAAAGESHTFVDAGSRARATPRTITMTSADDHSRRRCRTCTPFSRRGQVGYMLFNDHLATAEQELIDAVNQLKTAGIADLVLDIRYNGGGYLDIASELAYMIAGNARTAGKTFETTRIQRETPDHRSGDGRPAGAVRRSIEDRSGSRRHRDSRCRRSNLPRVFVLTGSRTPVRRANRSSTRWRASTSK